MTDWRTDRQITWVLPLSCKDCHNAKEKRTHCRHAKKARTKFLDSQATLRYRLISTIYHTLAAGSPYLVFFAFITIPWHALLFLRSKRKLLTTDFKGIALNFSFSSLFFFLLRFILYNIWLCVRVYVRTVCVVMIIPLIHWFIDSLIHSFIHSSIHSLWMGGLADRRIGPEVAAATKVKGEHMFVWSYYLTGTGSEGTSFYECISMG